MVRKKEPVRQGTTGRGKARATQQGGGEDGAVAAKSCGLSQRCLKLSEATDAGVGNPVIGELRQPRIGHAGFGGDLLPLALSLDQSGLQGVGVYVLHCRLIAKFCCPYKQFFEDGYGYSV
jgi:hypothetical protein